MTRLVLHTLEINSDDKNLLYDHSFQEEGRPLFHFPQEQLPWIESDVRPLAEGILEFLTQNATYSRQDFVVRDRLKDKGHTLFLKIFPSKLPTTLKDEKFSNSDLTLVLDEHLLWIPWELLYFDDQFLCQRFRVARQIERTYAEYLGLNEQLQKQRTGGALIAFGDTTNLKAKKERKNVHLALKEMYPNVVPAEELPALELLQQMTKRYSIVHYIGHGEYQEKIDEKTGWLCHDQKLLSTKDIKQMPGDPILPLLIFASACHSARLPPPSSGAAEEYIGHLSLAFLKRGVPHYIGTLAEIADERSGKFAETFYHGLRQGVTVGEALAKARSDFLRIPATPIWAYYVHYGDPAQKPISQGPVTVSPQQSDLSRKAGEVSTLRLRTFLISGAVLLTFIILWLAWKYDLPNYANQFPPSVIGISIAEFTIRDEVTGNVKTARYISSDNIHRTIETLRFPKPLKIRDLSRTFASSEEAIGYGQKTQSSIVVWGSGTKGKDTVQMDLILQLIPPRKVTKEIMWQVIQRQVVGFGPFGFRCRYDVRLDSLEGLDALVKDGVSMIIQLVGQRLHWEADTELDISKLESLFLSCSENAGIPRDWRDACQMQLAFYYLPKGRTRPAEALMISALERDNNDQDLWSYFFLSSQRMKKFFLGFPAEPHFREELVQSSFGELRFDTSVGTLSLDFSNGNFKTTKESAKRLMREIAAQRGNLTLSNPLKIDVWEYTTLLVLARLSVELGEYDEALRLADEARQRISTLPEDFTYRVYSAMFRESGNPAYAAKALSETTDQIEQAWVRELRGEQGAVLQELKRARGQGAADSDSLAMQLMTDGLWNGDRRQIQEALSVCQSSLGDGFNWEARPCSLLAADGDFFLEKEERSLERYKEVWPIAKLELTSEDTARILDLLGYVAVRRFGNTDVARKYFEDAYEQMSHSIRTSTRHVGLNEAISDLHLAIGVRTSIGLGYTAIRQGDLKKAIQFFKWAREHSGFGNYDAEPFLALAYASANNFDEANRTIFSTVHWGAKKIRVLEMGTGTTLGLIYHQEGRIQRAIEQFLGELRHADNEERTCFYLALLYLENQQSQQAMKYLERLAGMSTNRKDNVGCEAYASKRYAELGSAWEPRLCADQQYLQRRIFETKTQLSLNPKSVRVRDFLTLLLRIACRYGAKICDHANERSLLQEAIQADLRDSFNAPGLTRTPARRFIDLATLELDRGNPKEALDTLRNCIAWYTGDPNGRLWLLEATAMMDELHENRPREEKFPPFYFPSICWPRID